jgi:import inner membrane translocase subunit TIM16
LLLRPENITLLFLHHRAFAFSLSGLQLASVAISQWCVFSLFCSVFADLWILQAARIVANLMKTVVMVSGRAFVEAYQEALKSLFVCCLFLVFHSSVVCPTEAPKITIISSRPVKLTVEESYKILGVEKGAGREKVLETFQRHFEANDPEKGGSFYVQAKIYNAKETLANAGEI